MVRFLSPEWLDELDRAARTSPAPTTSGEHAAITVEQWVRTGGDDVRWQVRVDDGSVRVVAGGTDEADVTFEQDRDTAVAIATGKLSAQAAFIDGRLRVRGDLQRLVHHRDTLTALEDAFTAVRDTTTY